MSLARLRQQQGKKQRARKILAEIYGWFTEGFDTKDLQEAKALLEKLSRRISGPLTIFVAHLSHVGVRHSREKTKGRNLPLAVSLTI
jgi:hypothetical protein